MRGTRLRWLRGVLTASWLLLGCPAFARTRADDPPASTTPPLVAPRPPDGAIPPVNVLVNTPADLDALWKALARPDFVILRGDEYERLRATARPAGAPGRDVPIPWSAVVESVGVSGRVRDDQAALTLTLGISLAVDGPTWVPVRLDGLSLAEVREGQRDLPVRTAAGGGRQVELSGAGRHSVKIQAVVPVASSPEGARLDLPIPEAATTRFVLDVPRRVAAAHAGEGSPLLVAPAPTEGLSRISADLPPRPKLSVVWRVDDDSHTPLPPLLVAQGSIGIDVDAGSVRTRSSWSIHSVRGSARSLQFRLDPGDEVLELTLNGQTPPAGMDRVDGVPRMTIPLTDPLGPGQELKLAMTTRRSVPAGGVAQVAFNGFSITSARDQAGVIGVAQGAGLWVSGLTGRGVRQIDPRTELPDELRARPGTTLAYKFSTQPFELELRVEPAPPQVRTESRTTVTLEPAGARLDTWLDYQTARGRLFDLAVGVPPGLDVESVGPDEVVSSWQTGVIAPEAAPGSLRLLTVRLQPRVLEGGRFTLHVTGRQPGDPARARGVGLLSPLGVVSGGGRVAVLPPPTLTAEVSEPVDGNPGGVFRPAAQAPPPEWPWPSGRAPASPPMLWLRYAQTPSELPLRVTAHALAVTHSTALLVRVDPREVDVQQDTEFGVRFGSVDHLDLEVPARLEGRWEVDGTGVASRSDLGRTERGDRRFRLNLATELSRSVRLRFHYHLPLGTRLASGEPQTLVVPWLRPVGSAPGPGLLRATVTSDPALGVSVASDVWQPAADPAPAAAPAARLSRAAPESDVSALDLVVSLRTLASLPRVVVPRLAQRTTQTPEGELRTTAWLGVETRETGLTFGLPAAAELQRVRVDGRVIAQVEQAAPGVFRVALPARADTAPVPLEVDFTVPPARARGTWGALALPGGTVVQQSLWEVRVPWSRALVGVPAGWSDENEWYWDVYVWKRRPWRRATDLASWASGLPERAATAAPAGPDPDDPRGDYHAYMFGRPGRPVELPVTLVSRAWLVTLTSGLVLAVAGSLILVWRPPARLAWVAGLALALAVAALLHPSVTLLFLQSSGVGLLLAALLAVMQGFVERRRVAAAPYGTPTGSTPPPAPGSTFNRSVGVGSDDSTAIRGRPAANSTMDYAAVPAAAPDPATPPPAPAPTPTAGAPDAVVGRSSWSERVGQAEPAP